MPIPDKGNSILSVDDVYYIVGYYLSEYEYRKGKKHPYISNENMRSIVKQITERDDYGGIEEYVSMIDKYFDTNFKDCDYHIYHFLSGEIMQNRIYECGLI
jgi:hypothetical protein